MKIPATLILLAFASNLFAQRLLPVIDANYNLPIDVLDGEIHAMTTWNGNLIAAGKIESVNGMACNQIFQWDGTHYSTLGNGWAEGGSSYSIQCLAVHQGLLIAAGKFDTGEANQYVLRSFDGSSWSNHSPSALDGGFTDMIVHNGLLYVSGRFNDLFFHVTAFDGAIWQVLGSAFNDDVFDLEVFNGELYAAGAFTQNAMEVTDLNHFAKWNGGEWEQPGNGVNGDVHSMTVFENELILGGDFDAIIDGPLTGHLCKWNGSQLTFFEQPIGNEVFELFELDGQFGFAERIESDLLHLHIGDKIVRYRGMFGPVISPRPTVYVHNDGLFVGVEEHCSITEYNGETLNLMSGLMYLEKGTDEVFLEANNAKVPVTPFATFFIDPLLNRARFEVPAGNGVSPIYAASLWASGINSQGDSLVAATLFSNEAYGWSFGPIGNEVTRDYVKDYHRVWKVSAQEIEQHQNSFDNSDYVIPESIMNWPCNGNVLNGESHHLASFEDLNENGWYEPLLGEYPIIPGDECAYIILNDRFLQENYISDFESMNLEAHIMFYGYANKPEPIASTVFMKTKIFNRSSEDYADFRISSWSDFDLGSGFDDFVGSDSLAMLSYCYNGDSFDEASSSSPGYGQLPPAFGNAFLSLDMSSAIYYHNSQHPEIGVPSLPSHYFNFARGRNKVGADFQLGGITISPFAFNGEICIGEGETETNFNNLPNDRRSVASTNSTFLTAGESTCFEMAYIYFRNTAFNHLENACGLIDAVPLVKSFYENDIPACAVAEFPASVELEEQDKLFRIYPNPADDLLTIETTNRSISSYTITDALGKLVVVKKLPQDANRQVIAIDQLPQGVYFLQLNAENKTGVVRFVKN